MSPELRIHLVWSSFPLIQHYSFQLQQYSDNDNTKTEFNNVPVTDSSFINKYTLKENNNNSKGKNHFLVFTWNGFVRFMLQQLDSKCLLSDWDKTYGS